MVLDHVIDTTWQLVEANNSMPLIKVLLSCEALGFIMILFHLIRIFRIGSHGYYIIINTFGISAPWHCSYLAIINAIGISAPWHCSYLSNTLEILIP